MATIAKTKSDVDNMDARERLYDSLQYSYGKKRENTEEDYRKTYSQADRQLLSRGMQRSSYGGQTLANINTQRNKALGDIDDALIADYENRLYQLERDEKADEQWQKQFEEGVRQFDASQELTRSENALNRAFQTSEREATQKYNTSEREATQAYNTGEREATQAYNTSERLATQAYNTGEREASQAYQSGENALNREFQAGENALDREQSQNQFDTNLAYQKERAAVQDQQWTDAFKYQADRDARSDYQWGEEFRVSQEQNALDREQKQALATQEIAAEYARALLAAGQEVPNSLLQQAGLRIVGGQVVQSSDNSTPEVVYTGSTNKNGGGNSGNENPSNKPTANSLNDEAEAILDSMGKGNRNNQKYKNGRVVKNYTYDTLA